MTREEAWQGLQGYSLLIADGTDLKEALNMAIKALSAEEVVYVNDIDARTIKEIVRNAVTWTQDEITREYDMKVNIDWGNIDAVEVVRCKECIHYESDGGALMVCRIDDMVVDDTDYCSYGEREVEK